MRRVAPAPRGRVVALLASIAALTSALAPLAALAAPVDPLESSECQRALAALGSHEAAVAEASGASAAVSADDRRRIAAKLAPVRRQAARACLARSLDPPSSSPLARPPPIATAPLVVSPASAPAPSRSTAGPPPPAPRPAPAERPYAITSCDPGGCWANDGTRLNRVGPSLWGPRGVCTVQGSLVQCP